MSTVNQINVIILRLIEIIQWKNLHATYSCISFSKCNISKYVDEKLKETHCDLR